MYSVLEDSALYLREDVPEMPKNRYEFMNGQVTLHLYIHVEKFYLLCVCFCTVLALDTGLWSGAEWSNIKIRFPDQNFHGDTFAAL
jgi:hypothetical protein